MSHRHAGETESQVELRADFKLWRTCYDYERTQRSAHKLALIFASLLIGGFAFIKPSLAARRAEIAV